METQKNDENVILKLKRHLGKMMVQVDFLYRNGRELSQFDYDILMDRTREFYELLVDSQEYNMEKEEEEPENPTDTEVEFEIENQNEDEDDDDWEDEDDTIFSVEKAEETKEGEEETEETENEEDEETEEEMREETEIVENEEENDDEETEKEEHVTFFNIEPVEEPEKTDDNSLASRLQHQPISDIKTAVSLNDRIMMTNDLFRGSSERYNKTINILNEFPTFGGAVIYLNELRIELQWDVESEAYLKLKELVERRFLTL
ncbi:MAG: hypothetical protein KBT67_03200 [bacterium]|nr:hypothetical protein [Candidatus Limimorpha caballi]